MSDNSQPQNQPPTLTQFQQPQNSQRQTSSVPSGMPPGQQQMRMQPNPVQGGMPLGGPGGSQMPPNMINPSQGASGNQQMRQQQSHQGGIVAPPNNMQMPMGANQGYPARQGSQMQMNAPPGNMPPNMRGGERGTDPYSSMQSAELQRNQANQHKQNLNKYIKEEIVNFSYTQLPPQLEELYNIQHSTVYKAIYNQSAFGGKRMKKLDEPKFLASQQDFLLAEMTNMAIDFQEESLFRKVLNFKIAREAQSFILIKKEKERQKAMREEEKREKARLIEEQKFAAEQIIVPESQPMHLEEMLLPESQSLNMNVSLSGLLRVDSIAPHNDNMNNLSNAFDDPFFNENENNGLNDNFDDNNMLFQNQNLNDNDLMIDNMQEQPSDFNLLPPDMQPLNLQPDQEVEMIPLEIKPTQPKAEVITDILDFSQMPEHNLLDDIDLFYQVPSINQLINEFDDLNLEIKPTKSRQNPEDQSKFGTFQKQDNFAKTLNDQDSMNMDIDEQVNLVTNSIIERKLNKFKDILIRDYASKKEDKRLKEQQKDLMSQLQRQETIENEHLNVDNFLGMDLQRQSQIQQQQQERSMLQNQLQKINTQLNQIKLSSFQQQMDIKYKKKEITVFQPNDIFNQAMNEMDQSDLPTYDSNDDQEENKNQMQQKQKPPKKQYVRPESENPYSDDDMDFFNSVPDQQYSEFYELFLKSYVEKTRKMAVQSLEKATNPQQINMIRQKLVESDYLLQPEKLAKIALKQLINKNNLNPQINYDPEQLRVMLKNNPNKRALGPIEQAFMYWYVSIMGDEWRVIADVINFHPLTKGGIRDSEELKNYFFLFSENANLYYHIKIPIDPWRSTGMPMLINQRPPSLLSSVHQQCLIHLNNIKAFQKSLEINRGRYKVIIDQDENGKIVLRQGHTDNQIKDEEMKEEGGDQEIINTSTNLLGKRSSSNKATEGGEQNQSQPENHLIDQNLQSDLIREQFTIQAQINSEFQENINYRVFEANKLANQCGDARGAQISFYEYYDKLYQQVNNNSTATNKRRRLVEEQKVSDNQINGVRAARNNVGPQNQLYTNKIDPNEANTPMMNSLSVKLLGQDGAAQDHFQKSIFYKSTMSYWIAYLLKKLYQQDKDQILKFKNQKQLEQHELQTKTVLSNRIHKAAEQSCKMQKAKLRGETVVSQEELQSQLRLKNIQESMKNYEIEKKVGDVDNLGDIWGSTTIWQYDANHAINQLNSECENTADRPPEILKQIWDKKWETMDYYWFQKHKQLGPNEKKKDPSQKFLEHFQKLQAAANMPPGTQYPPPGAAGGLPPPGVRPSGNRPGSPRGAGLSGNDPQSIPPGTQSTMDASMTGTMPNLGQMIREGDGQNGQPPNTNINLMRTQQQISQQQSMQRQQQDMMRQQQHQQQMPPGQYPPPQGANSLQQMPGGGVPPQLRPNGVPLSGGNNGAGMMPRQNSGQQQMPPGAPGSQGYR
eukprot:403346707